MRHPIRTVELIGWGLDDYCFRPGPVEDTRVQAAERLLRSREPCGFEDVLCPETTERLRDELRRQHLRADLREEMDGLDWSLGVVKVECLLAFQRRLSFRPEQAMEPVPAQTNWPGLLELSFAAQAPVTCEVRHDAEAGVLTITSANPNLHLRVTHDPVMPIAVHGGSSFFEVSELRGRWFLRDGYHRASLLLSAGVSRVPAVIVRARSLAELGAVGPQFFEETVLFGKHPPRVRDFLDSALTIEYERPVTVTTLRVTMEKFVTSEAALSPGEQL